ncbi:hypothetical protein EHS25_008708 [Saitozyma podzolica]|uniref:phosphatidylserine decarboxylase n=1 Tax=Saitozyma podzolica TaxID=1890683 RepID=A0A427YMI0_9TREE|nr:hypothetical protein EHS25_008708 [Saitozyma podzolica]
MPSSSESSSQPKLRRLAAKPLKLAASTLRPLSLSRSSSPAPSSSASVLNLTASSDTLVPGSGGGGLGLGSDGTSLPSASGSGFGTGTGTGRLGRRKRLRHLSAGASNMTPAQVASAARGPRKPLEGEEPAAWVRVRVVRAQGLVAKDRNGTSDPFISVLLAPSHRNTTSVVKRTLDPSFPPESSTFDYPLYLSLAGLVGGRGLEFVVWDKDLMRKEYMGEMAIPLKEWFPDGLCRLWDENLSLVTRPLLSTRRRHKVSGTVSLQIGFIPPKDAPSTEDALKRIKSVYDAVLDRSDTGRDIIGVLGVPAHQGIGTIKMRSKKQHELDPLAPSAGGGAAHPAVGLLHATAAAVVSPLAGLHKAQPITSAGLMDLDDEDDEDEDVLADDGLSSSSDEEYEDALEEEEEYHLKNSPPDLEHVVDIVSDETIVSSTRPAARGSSEDQVPKTASLVVPETSTSKAKPPKTPTRQTSLPGYFDSYSHSWGTKRRPIFKRTKSKTPGSKKNSKDFNFDASQQRDVLGIVILEIKGATDLPKLRNALRVSFDMDPFVVISFGKKVFRTRVIRHSLNPTWDEKLLFHVRRHESAFTLSFAVLDWDKISGNDMVGTCKLPLSELVADAPKPDPESGLYAKHVDGKHDMREFTLPITTEKDMPWEAKHSPKLTIRAKYEPYDALRQRFWRQYITQYDVDETNTMSYTELTAMLDSLGSTLTRQTIEGYFDAWGKSAATDELEIDEVIQCLEWEVTKPKTEKAKLSREEGSTSATPSVPAEPAEDGLAMNGPQGNIPGAVDPDELAEHIPETDSTLGVPSVRLERRASISDDAQLIGEPSDSGGLTPSGVSDIEVDQDNGDDSGDASPADNRERVINIRTCPLCHRPRLGRKSEQDIVTHLAVCASADWSRVDRIVTANYVTSSQAQRKFLTRMMNKVAIGAYSLGANSANILVQDRMTGQLQEEKMAVYVRLGIRVLYKGWRGQMEGGRARRLLKSLSVKQGIKYDSPVSAADIAPFIAFHKLDIDEILDPLYSFNTFNEFFFRKLKPSARPVDEPGNDYRLVSCADCRMMAFETVEEATRIWIKGREFTVGRLLGPNYKDVWDRYNGGALAIFRLAPQDYHRFHSPVKGTIGKMTLIDGEYYTVNPQAIRTMLDVYGENVRKVVPVHSDEFGQVMTVWVGAMNRNLRALESHKFQDQHRPPDPSREPALTPVVVGSILTSVEEGQLVERGDELGYFAFGGSTIVCLFEKGAVQWDEDLLGNGRAAIETLVRMGMGIGRSKRGNGGNGNGANGNGNGTGTVSIPIEGSEDGD